MPKSNVDREQELGEENRTTDNTTRTFAKNAAERAREYRARKKILLGESSGTNTKKTPAKSAADYARAYRARKKAKRALLVDSATAAAATPPKSAAERMREYRARKKALLVNVAQTHSEEIPNLDTVCAESIPSCSDYRQHETGHNEFNKKTENNTFGACSVCDRFWLKDDLKTPTAENRDILRTFIPKVDMGNIVICSTCKLKLDKQDIPAMSTYKGLKYL